MKAKSNGKKRTPRKPPPFAMSGEGAADAEPGRDYTPEILEFLRGAHGGIRIDAQGDYYYEGVSTLSLHFLLKSHLPGKELLWRWYHHFEVERSEDIYQTLPPQRDGEFLEILSNCKFEWDRDAVRQSGLLFLPEHRTEVYLGLEEWLSMRLEEYETMSDAELREALHPKDTWSDAHLKKLLRKIQTQPLTVVERQRVYQQFESEYLRATARHLLDEATQDTFWKSPPPELESLHGRFIIFSRTMANTARRLGVYTTRKEHEGASAFGGWNGSGTGWKRRAGADGRGNTRSGNGGGYAKGGRFSPNGSHAGGNGMAAEHFEALGLAVGATVEDVKVAYREQVKLHHPDQGGSVQDFLRLQEAYEYLLTQVF